MGDAADSFGIYLVLIVFALVSSCAAAKAPVLSTSKDCPVRTLGFADEVNLCLFVGGGGITCRPVGVCAAALFSAGSLPNLGWGVFSIHSASCLVLAFANSIWAGSITGLAKSRLRGRTSDGADGSSSGIKSGISGYT